MEGPIAQVGPDRLHLIEADFDAAFGGVSGLWWIYLSRTPEISQVPFSRTMVISASAMNS